MELNLSTGGAINSPTLDVNGNGVIDNNDYIGSPGVYAGGVQFNAMPSAVRLQKNQGSPGNPPGPRLQKRTSLSDKTISTIDNPLGPQVGRVTWREITQ